MPNLRGSEWLIIILLVVLLFGAKRLPDAARSVGRSLRIFKAETKGLVADGEGDEAQAAPAQTTPSPAVTASAPPAVGSPPAAAVPGQPVTQQPAAPAEVATPALRPEPGELGTARQPEPPQQPTQA